VTWWIRQAITRALAEHSGTIHIPEYMQTHVRRLAVLQDKPASATGQSPSVADIAVESPAAGPVQTVRPRVPPGCGPRRRGGRGALGAYTPQARRVCRRGASSRSAGAKRAFVFPIRRVSTEPLWGIPVETSCVDPAHGSMMCVTAKRASGHGWRMWAQANPGLSWKPFHV
jgi:hypothetical protein